MGNTAQITSDLQYVIANDCTDGGKLPISKRGVLLSVLGNNLTGSPVTAELDKTIADMLRGKTPFFEFEVKELNKNHICISYQEQSNTVFIIGITDVVAALTGPFEVASNKTKMFAIKLKDRPDTGLMSKGVVLVRLETAGLNRFLRFYYLLVA